MSNLRLTQLFCLGIGLFPLILLAPAQADPLVPVASSADQTQSPVPAATVAEWEAQIAQSLVQITGVELAPTQTGFNLLLNASSPLPQPQTRVEGNALIAEIDNAVLTETFEQANPTTEIAQVSVVALEGNRVQITITGVEGPPTAEIRGCLRSRKALIGYSLSIDKPTRVISF